MLAAVPRHIPCIGIELDPAMVVQARQRTGRPIIEGNCLTADISQYGRPTAVFGNPPFILTLFEKLLDRCATMLDIGNKAGFVLPAYFFQTSSTTYRLSRKWAISQEIIPRDLFYRLTKPLVFATFVRDNTPQLIGFRLFGEAMSMREFSAEVQDVLSSGVTGSRSVWRNAIVNALNKLGGQATLTQIYSTMRDNRPTNNEFWKEKIRQILQQKHFVRIEEGCYALPT
jgi:site-specific DNA-methyltransferase (adenine-specific)